MIEMKESFIESIPLPFASVAFSENYHLALLRNLGVDGGLVAFSRPADSYYVSSTVGLPPVLPSTELEISSFCKLISRDMINFNGNVLRMESVIAHLPKMQGLVNDAGYKYMRIYRINDFLAANGYWLMFFQELPAANAAGQIINRSLSSPQFRESISGLVSSTPEGDALDEIVNNWVPLLDKRDKETEEHTKRVARMAVELARLIGMEDCQIKDFYRGALLHDIGKIVIPNEILYKPGALTEAEWKIMRLHPRIVKDLLRNFDFPRPILEIPYAHHEKWDGSGYPHGLKGEQIPLSARVFSIVDVWDAMLADRPYRKRFKRPEVLAYIQDQRGKHFDPQITDVFLHMVGTGL